MEVIFWLGLLLIGFLAYIEANKASYDNYVFTMTLISAITGGLVWVIAAS